MHSFNSICIIGLGYIGLPTAAVFARSGLQVVGVDTNKSAIECINNGEAHIVETDLDSLVRCVVANDQLRAQQIPVNADAYIIAVPTPFTNSFSPDMSYVEAAVKSIAPFITEGALIVLESTVPPGTTHQLVDWLENTRKDLKGGCGTKYYVAHCPERVLPGKILTEIVSNDRIVGGITSECSERAKDLYTIISKGKILLTDAKTAELTKLAENSFRDVNIAYANEMANICEKLEINVWELIELANRHPRVNILQPGPGVGGHCIAVDPWFIVSSTPEEAKLIKLARRINDSRPAKIAAKVVDFAKNDSESTIAFLGLSFKPDVDDLRTSPAIEVVRICSEKLRRKFLISEPYISELPVELSNAGHTLVSYTEAIEKGDILVLLVDHTIFTTINTNVLTNKTVIDTRGVWRECLS